MNTTRNILFGLLSLVLLVLPNATPAEGQGILQRLEERVRQRLQEGAVSPPPPANPDGTANRLPAPDQRAPGQQRPTLGVEVDEIAGGGAPGELVVAVVHPDTAAAAAGLQSGDRIIRFGGVPVDSVEDLAGVLSRSQPGDRLLLVVDRDGEPTQLTVTLAEPTAAAPNEATAAAPDSSSPPANRANQRTEARSFPTDPAGPPDAELPGGGRLGLTVEDPPVERGRRLQRGALVTEVTPGAPGDRAGLRTGDLIVALDGALIPDARTLILQMRQTRPGQRVDLQYVRDERLGRATVTLAGPDGVPEQSMPGSDSTGDDAAGRANAANGAAEPGLRQPPAGGSVLGDVGSMLGGLFGGQQPNPAVPNPAVPNPAAPDTAAPAEAETLPPPDADVPPSLSQSELEDASGAELRSTVRQLEAANRRLEQRLQQLEAQMQAILEVRSSESID